jgi:hypothetical protein
MASLAGEPGYSQFDVMSAGGHHVWRNASEHVIDTGATDAGISAARQRLGSTVHESALADLSAVDRT